MMTAFAADRTSEADSPSDRDTGERRDNAPGGAVFNTGALVLAAETAIGDFTRAYRSFGDEDGSDDTADQRDQGELANADEATTSRDIPPALPRAVGGPAVAAVNRASEQVDVVADDRPAGHVDVDASPPALAPGEGSGMKGGGPDRPVPSPQDDHEGGEGHHDVLPVNFGPKAGSARYGGGAARGGTRNAFEGSDAVRDVETVVMSERRIGWDKDASREIRGRRVVTEVTDHASGVHVTMTMDLPYGDAGSSSDSSAADLADYRKTTSDVLARKAAERGVLALEGMLGREARPESRDVTAEQPVAASVSPEVAGDVRLVPAAEARKLALEVQEMARKKGDHVVAVDEYTLRGALIAAGGGGEYVSLTSAELHELTKVVHGGFMHLLVGTDNRPPELSTEERGLRDRALSFVSTPERGGVVAQRYGVGGPVMQPVDIAATRGQSGSAVTHAIIRGREDFQNAATALATGTFDSRVWQDTHPEVKSSYGLAESLGQMLPMSTTTAQAREAAKEALEASGRFTPVELQIAADLYGLADESPFNETGAMVRLRNRDEPRLRKNQAHYHRQVNAVYRRLAEITASPGS